MPRILVTEPIVKEPLEKLKQWFDVVVAERHTYQTPEKLQADIPEFDGLLCMLSTPVNAEVITAGTNLKIIANYAVGYDNIDIDAARKAGIHVANTPGVLTEATADLAFSLLLAVARQIKEADSFLRKGQFDGWHPLGFLGTEIHDKTLGIVGMGQIGGAVARRALGFGMNILYHNRSPVSPEREKQLKATYIDDIRELAQKVDILSLNCPLTSETHHLIDREILQLMPQHALLINTARGPVVDEAALANALHNKTIAGAGLDVFEKEPAVHPDILSAPHTVVTPHIGSATRETRNRMGNLAINAIKAILEGNKPDTIPNLVC